MYTADEIVDHVNRAVPADYQPVVMAALRKFLDWSIPVAAWRLGDLKVECVNKPGVEVSWPQFTAQAMRAAQWDEYRRVAERSVYREYVQALQNGCISQWESLHGRRVGEKWNLVADAGLCMQLGDQAYACGVALPELVKCQDPDACGTAKAKGSAATESGGN
jgi:hypothetical protein